MVFSFLTCDSPTNQQRLKFALSRNATQKASDRRNIFHLAFYHLVADQPQLATVLYQDAIANASHTQLGDAIRDLDGLAATASRPRCPPNAGTAGSAVMPNPHSWLVLVVCLLEHLHTPAIFGWEEKPRNRSAIA